MRSKPMQVWHVDFEFQIDVNLRPRPVSMVAREHHTGTEIRMWRDELERRNRAPFSTGDDSVMVAYAANAELAVFRQLGWPMPRHVLDLYVEFAALDNRIRKEKYRASLIEALHHFGVEHLDSAEKFRRAGVHPYGARIS